ncbi:MAG: chemotaxis protein CheB, partial [Balneolales bacterium]
MAKKKKTAAPKKSAPLKKNKPKKDSNSGKGFPIVGIGASAGGLAAFEAFFSAIPDDKQTGMAFVLVQHLAPGHKSELSHLIQRCTHLPATEARDRMRLEPDHIYTIPSNRYLAVRDGALQLTKPQDERGHRHPVDFLFRSLADDRHEQAVGIVLSGTASDGTQGVRDVKCAGGMVMVQDPDTAEYDGMPRNAMATGQVDYVLAPDEMPAKLAGYFTHKSGKTALSGPSATSTGSGELNNVFGLLRSQTGHDFSKYKQTTINRRIERRMTVQQISRLEEYVRYLRETPDEVTVLFRDLLIGVTRFFRDPEMFDALKRQVIPGLFEDKQPGTEVRVWVPGCSTGEEAYSIAILLREHIEGLDRHYKVQVFATDIDSRAIHTARIGAYPAGIVGDISEERLKRFFTKGPDGDTYRIGKSIRDLLIFSEQNVINDPPFSRLDLVSCRNLLIYMGEKLQKKLIPLFHYALKPDGMLFLGTSESVGEFTGLFTTLDAKAKLYRKQKDGDHGETGKFPPWPEKDEKTATPHIEGNKDSKPVTNNHDLTVTALLQHYNPAAVLVDEQGAVRYIHGRSGRYLEPAPGGDG